MVAGGIEDETIQMPLKPRTGEEDANAWVYRARSAD